RPGNGLEHRRQVDVRDAEAGEVLCDLACLGEPEIRGELQPVSRHRHPARSHIPPMTRSSSWHFPPTGVRCGPRGTAAGAASEGCRALSPGAAAAAHYDGM